jgi:hypothetical protein
MKAIITQLTMIGMSLIAVSLMFVGQSFAKIDKQSIAGVWLFDENTGKVAKDISENGNDGNLMGNPKWVNGKFGKALDFNGSTDYVEVADSKSLDITGDITIVVWLYKRPAGRGTLLGKWKQVGDVWSYVLYDRGEGGGGWRLRWADQSQTNLEDPYTFPDNEWVHNAATYDGSKMKVFENGKEIGTIDANKKINVTENPVWIGNDGYQQHFNGILDEVAIFNVALTVDEIQSIMGEGLSKTLAVSASGKVALTWGNIKVKP